MEITLEVKNLEQVQRNAEAVAKKLSDGSLVARAALVIERQAKINATGRPGPKVQTRRLRASITIDILDNTKARVGTNVYYAPFLEFGHSQEVGRFVPAYALGKRGGGWEVTRGLGFRLKNPRAPAYPFLFPAVEQTREQTKDVMVTFGSELGQEWAR